MPIDHVHRNAVLRAWFEGCDWNEHPEFQLKRRFVLRSNDLLPGFPFLVDDEWEVSPGYTNEGRGDLLFTDGEGRFAVVEVKHIDLDATGRTARAKRTDGRKVVVEQARKYARLLASRLGAPVDAFTYTNERPDAALPASPQASYRPDGL